MIYEVSAGSRTTTVCEIKAYDDDYELLALYRGNYNRRGHVWEMRLAKKYAQGRDMPYRINLGEGDVREYVPRVPMKPMRPQEKKKEAPEKGKQRPWWTLPDPEGQIKLR